MLGVWEFVIFPRARIALGEGRILVASSIVLGCAISSALGVVAGSAAGRQQGDETREKKQSFHIHKET